MLRGASVSVTSHVSGQKHSLLHVWADIVTQQEGAKKELEEKYGKVNIDLKTGEYKEIKEDEPKK